MSYASMHVNVKVSALQASLTCLCVFGPVHWSHIRAEGRHTAIHCRLCSHPTTATLPLLLVPRKWGGRGRREAEVRGTVDWPFSDINQAVCTMHCIRLATSTWRIRHVVPTACDAGYLTCLLRSISHASISNAQWQILTMDFSTHPAYVLEKWLSIRSIRQ